MLKLILVDTLFNQDEPILEATQISKPHAHITGIALTEWDRIAPILYNYNILTELCIAALGVYCQPFGIYARALDAIETFGTKDGQDCGLLIKTTSGTSKENPLVGIANKAAADMVRYATEFGMTPSSRTKIKKIIPAKPNNSATDKYLS